MGDNPEPENIFADCSAKLALLLDAGADVNAILVKQENITLMDFVIMADAFELAQFMMPYKPNITENRVQTVLRDAAVSSKYINIIHVLLYDELISQQNFELGLADAIKFCNSTLTACLLESLPKYEYNNEGMLG